MDSARSGSDFSKSGSSGVLTSNKQPPALFPHLRLHLPAESAGFALNAPPSSRANSVSPSSAFLLSIHNNFKAAGFFDDPPEPSSPATPAEPRPRFGSSFTPDSASAFLSVLQPIRALDEDELEELEAIHPNPKDLKELNDFNFGLGKAKASGLGPTHLSLAPTAADRLNCSGSLNSCAQAHNLQFQSEKVRSLPFLFNLLVKVFLMDVRVSEVDLALSPLELHLLLQLLKRKFKRLSKCLDHRSLESSNRLWEVVERVKGEKSTKRIEERKKFVFKHTMKKLREQFLRRADFVGRGEAAVKLAFYAHYFGELALQRGLDLLAFYDPLNPKNGNTRHKTLSNEYLALLFESVRFRQDFADYVGGMGFYIDYQKSTVKKIEKLLVKWVRLLAACTDGSERLWRLIDDYFARNKQCKLPWTPKEIAHAIASFKKHLVA